MCVAKSRARPPRLSVPVCLARNYRNVNPICNSGACIAYTVQCTNTVLSEMESFQSVRFASILHKIIMKPRIPVQFLCNYQAGTFWWWLSRQFCLTLFSATRMSTIAAWYNILKRNETYLTRYQFWIVSSGVKQRCQNYFEFRTVITDHSSSYANVKWIRNSCYALCCNVSE